MIPSTVSSERLKEKVNINERFAKIRNRPCHRKFSFRELLKAQHSRMEIIVTFLCILELI